MSEVPQLLRNRTVRAQRVYLEPGDVAERVVLVGAVALDGRVEGWVVVDRRVVRRRAGAGVPADVPRRRRAQPQLAQDRVHRRRFDRISLRRRRRSLSRRPP